MPTATFGLAYSPITGQIMAWDGAKFEPTSTITAALTFTKDATFSGNVTLNSTAQFLGGNITFSAIDVVLDTSTGTKIGTDVAQKLSFWNATPVVQPAGAAQAAPAAYATGAFGLDSDANMHALYDLVVAIRTALVAAGIMKGSA